VAAVDPALSINTAADVETDVIAAGLPIGFPKCCRLL
jgi:hypothetical protein